MKLPTSRWQFTFLFRGLFLILGMALCLGSCRRRPEDPPPSPYLAFVANRHGRSVAVVNLSQFKTVASIPLSAEPEELLVRPGSHEVFAVSFSGIISIITHPDHRLAGTIRIGHSARDLCFSPNGSAAYVADPDKGQIVFLDGGGRELSRLRVDSKLSGLQLSPDGKTLVAVNSEARRIFVVSAANRKVLDTIAVGANPGPMGILPDSSKVFVANSGEKMISAIDLASRRLLSNLQLGSVPSSLVVKPDGGEIFVLSASDSTLTILDAFHDNVEQTFTTGREPVAAVLRSDASVLYIASAADGNIIALDAPNRVVLASTHVGIAPRALALTPDERFLLVADSGTSSLEVLRTDRNALVTTIPVGDQPVDVVVPDWLRK